MANGYASTCCLSIIWNAIFCIIVHYFHGAALYSVSVHLYNVHQNLLFVPNALLVKLQACWDENL